VVAQPTPWLNHHHFPLIFGGLC